MTFFINVFLLLSWEPEVLNFSFFFFLFLVSVPSRSFLAAEANIFSVECDGPCTNVAIAAEKTAGDHFHLNICDVSLSSYLLIVTMYN